MRNDCRNIQSFQALGEVGALVDFYSQLSKEGVVAIIIPKITGSCDKSLGKDPASLSPLNPRDMWDFN